MGGFSTILMFAVMIGLIFMMQRQQKKAAQDRQQQLDAMQPGDQVVTIGGMYAHVDEIDHEANRVVLDVDGVFLPFELSAIKRIVAKADAVTVSDTSIPEVTEIKEETVASEDSAVITEESNDSVIESH